jgi:hypothetical protein
MNIMYAVSKVLRQARKELKGKSKYGEWGRGTPEAGAGAGVGVGAPLLMSWGVGSMLEVLCVDSVGET